MTKKNNKDKKSTVKSDKDKPQKNNIIFFVMNKKNNKKENEDKDDENKDDDNKNDKKNDEEKKDIDHEKLFDNKEEESNIVNDEKLDDKESNDINLINKFETFDEYDDYSSSEYDDDDDEDYIPSEDYEDEDYDNEENNTTNETEEFQKNNDENDLEEGEIYEDDNEYEDDYNDDEQDDDEEDDDEQDDDDDEQDNQDEEKFNNSRNKRKADSDPLDNIFNVIIGGSSIFNKTPHLPGRNRFRLSDKELESKRKNKKQKKENFYDYFKEAKKLLPINKEINNLQDLIDLGETYDKKDKNRYVINMKALNKCLEPLKELNKFIGMKKIKEMILDLIFLRLQNIDDKSENEMWHLVVQGSPGCGKTEVSRVIGKLYYGLGIVTKNEFTQVKRSQLIGKWCGHTAAQTQDIFDKAEGGVLFIDEAYSLGNPDQKDSFTKECIDTINQNLTEKKNTVVIIAGYKEQLDESFFSYNPGLARRFKMRLSVDSYNFQELREIYLKKLYENDWQIMNDDSEKEIPLDFFERNRDIFKFNGGDMENLWSLTKVVHCRRIFGKDNSLTKKITKEDVYKAFEKYKENEEVSNRDDDKALKKYIHDTMYC